MVTQQFFLVYLGIYTVLRIFTNLQTDYIYRLSLTNKKKPQNTVFYAMRSPRC